MVALGIIPLIVGSLLKISILWSIGIVILVIGAVLFLLGSVGRSWADDTSSDVVATGSLGWRY